MRFWFLLCLAPLLVVVQAFAQDPPVFELPEVIVPGRRPQSPGSTPASVTVITRAEIERLGARTIAEVLRLVPELTIRTYGGFGSLAEPSIRGFGPGQVLVTVDGIPVNNVALGQADLSTISTAGVERIEVLRGAFGAISGSGAVGGVINIVTSAEAGPLVAARTGGAGERGLRLSGGTGRLAVSLEAAGSDGFRPNSDAATMTAIAGLTLGGATRINVHHTRMHVGTPGDIAFPTPQDRQSLERTILQSQWGTGTDSSRGRLYYVTEQLDFSSPFGASAYASSILGGEIQRQWDLAPGRVLVGGLEMQRQQLDALVFGSSIIRDAVLGAGYLQYDAALSARSLASFAVRVDTHSTYGMSVNPRAGIVVNIHDHLRVRLGAGRTFRGPTYLHLYFPGCSDPSLRPESAWTAEASVERIFTATIFTITAFASEATDLISGGCPPQNIGAASIRGASAEVRGQLRGALSGRLNLTAMQATDRATGMGLPRVPDITAHAAFTYNLWSGSTLTLLGEYVGRRPDMDFSVFPAVPIMMPGYFDLALRYHRESPSGWAVVVGVNNLLDSSYEAVKGYPVPGRTMFVSASRRY
ncbi:MAG: TonB-dependent receptor plug domain-containing protein [bacterium]